MTTETKCVKIRLKPGSVNRVREWASTVNDLRRTEALRTLQDEGVVIEAAALDCTPDGDFLIYFMKARSFEAAKAAAVASTHDIDRYHNEFKRETWGETVSLEVVLDLDLFGDVPNL